MNLELVNLTPEIRAAIAAIASLSSSPVILRETVILETPDPEIGALLARLLVDHLVPANGHKPEAAAVARQVQNSKLELRICEGCGKEYPPRRKDQKFCSDPDCKREQARIYAAKHSGNGSPAPEVAAPAPLR